MNFKMPEVFPSDSFSEFGKRAGAFFPRTLSDADLDDQLERRQHFQQAWLGVCYRFRGCAEQSLSFKALYQQAMVSDLWREWSVGGEHSYEIEQCIYTFFANALSTLECFAFCLYFVGSMLDPRAFNKISKPRDITPKSTLAAYRSALPNAPITQCMDAMIKDPAFVRIDTVRNMLAHRLAGKRTVSSVGSTGQDGSYNCKRDERWYIPGLNGEIIFDDQLIERELSELTRLIAALSDASLEFIKEAKLP